jgi:phosphatidylserine/phosphatidylglycerophosphate/cardiolipin synthase-like enzyme
MTTPPGRPPDRVVIAPPERRQAVLDVIDQARESIILSLFRCNDGKVLEALARAVARGVTVDVLMTQRAKGGTKKRYKLWAAVEATGASVHPYSDAVVKYHAKYLVADDGPSIVASLNFTKQCFKRTIDAIVVTHDPAVASGLRMLMEADRDNHQLPPNLPARLVIGPERARRKYRAIIQGAQRRVLILDRKAGDPALFSLLKARREAGIEITLFDQKELGGLRSHGKIMLVDDAVAVIGGLSLNALGLDFRREVAIVVDEPDAVAEVRRLFDDVAAAVEVSAQAAGAARDDAGDLPC